MSVRKGDGERRFIEVELEVPGTPEEVWAAIATGEGISSWFGATKSDERAGGQLTGGMWPGMESTSDITSFDPPRSFAMESAATPEGLPKFAAEWIVEARSGGKCVVRLVQSLFASGDDWDGELENLESGWPQLLAMLRLYLRHFRGRAGVSVQLLWPAPSSEAEAWGKLGAALGFAETGVGERTGPGAPGAPTLAGVLEERSDGAKKTAHLRLDGPAPGIAWIGAFTFHGMVMLGLRMFLYADDAAEVAAAEQAAWQAWLASEFPQAS